MIFFFFFKKRLEYEVKISELGVYIPQRIGQLSTNSCKA